MTLRFGLRSSRVLFGGGLRPAVVIVAGEQIEAVVAPGDHSPDLAVEDLGDAVLMAGLVDSHVHINDPGRTEWEGFATATRAAAAGGVTTLVDMPLNSAPVTTTPGALAAKLRTASEEALRVDVGFWGGVVPGNAEDLGVLTRDGALGAKAFLCFSGIDEFPASDEDTLRRAMRVLAEHDAPLLVHAELEREDPSSRAALAALPADDYRVWLESRPKSFEEEAVARAIAVARRTGARVHVVHLSAASALPLLRAAKDEGLPVTVETCPHYLALTAEEVPRGGTIYKCAPPIREASNRELLWEGLRDGTIDFIVSDHSPCTPALKHLESGDFLAAWGGIAGLQLALPIVWTEARARGFGIADLGRWLSAGPARFAGLSGRKGELTPGADADLLLWDPDAPVTPTKDTVRFKHAVSPWLGRPMVGAVRRTWLRGAPVFDAGIEVGAARGRPLLGRTR